MAEIPPPMTRDSLDGVMVGSTGVEVRVASTGVEANPTGREDTATAATS